MIFPDEKASEDLRETEQLDARDVFAYTEVVTDQNIQDETALKALTVNAKEALSDQHLAVREGEDIKKTWAQELEDHAKIQTYKASFIISTDVTTIKEYIAPG